MWVQNHSLLQTVLSETQINLPIISSMNSSQEIQQTLHYIGDEN